MITLKVGTRRSKLATTQTTQVLQALRDKNPDIHFETVEIVTQGDQIQDVALAKVGGKGLFVSDIETALLNKTIDLAVHSMKDVPAVLADGLMIGAIPMREDPRDMLITKHGDTLSTLKKGAVIGTSSLRRAAQILALRPDVVVQTIRGNIDTRLQKLQELDAITLATAGLARMGWWDGERILYGTSHFQGQPLAIQDMIPAVGQGALAIECRADDQSVLTLLSTIHDKMTAIAIQQERAFLATVGGSCQVPIGALAIPDLLHAQSTILAVIASPDGTTVLKTSRQGSLSIDLGRSVAIELLDAGGQSILQALSKTGG